MSKFTDFFPAAGGGLKPKFQEFTSSGTFTPSQALVDAGGFIEIFLVAGGEAGSYANYGGTGGEVKFKNMYLTSTTGCAVTIGAGGSGTGANGSNSVFTGASAGGSTITAKGGEGNGWQNTQLGSSSGGGEDSKGNPGILGYGGGGARDADNKGIQNTLANSGQGSYDGRQAGSGYCLIKYYE